MIADIFKIATPYILASAGGLFTEISGSLNIALEGQILTGAFWTIAVAELTGSLFLGILAGIAAACVLSLIAAFFSFHLKANIFISGLAANLLAYGHVSLFSTLLFGSSGVIRSAHMRSGNIMLFTLFAILVIPASRYILNKTLLGLRIRAAGISENVLFCRGLNPDFYRYMTMLFSGALCGLAGAFLAVRIGAFVPNISAGRGWIALVVVYLGYRKPAGLLLGCLLFAAAESLANWTQGVIGMPATIILALPFLLTLIVLTVISIYRKNIS